MPLFKPGYKLYKPPKKQKIARKRLECVRTVLPHVQPGLSHREPCMPKMLNRLVPQMPLPAVGLAYRRAHLGPWAGGSPRALCARHLPQQ